MIPRRYQSEADITIGSGWYDWTKWMVDRANPPRRIPGRILPDVKKPFYPEHESSYNAVVWANVLRQGGIVRKATEMLDELPPNLYVPALIVGFKMVMPFYLEALENTHDGGVGEYTPEELRPYYQYAMEQGMAVPSEALERLLSDPATELATINPDMDSFILQPFSDSNYPYVIHRFLTAIVYLLYTHNAPNEIEARKEALTALLELAGAYTVYVCPEDIEYNQSDCRVFAIGRFLAEWAARVRNKFAVANIRKADITLGSRPIYQDHTLEYPDFVPPRRETKVQGSFLTTEFTPQLSGGGVGGLHTGVPKPKSEREKLLRINAIYSFWPCYELVGYWLLPDSDCYWLLPDSDFSWPLGFNADCLIHQGTQIDKISAEFFYYLLKKKFGCKGSLATEFENEEGRSWLSERYPLWVLVEHLGITTPEIFEALLPGWIEDAPPLPPRTTINQLIEKLEFTYSAEDIYELAFGIITDLTFSRPKYLIHSDLWDIPPLNKQIIEDYIEYETDWFNLGPFRFLTTILTNWAFEMSNFEAFLIDPGVTAPSNRDHPQHKIDNLVRRRKNTPPPPFSGPGYSTLEIIELGDPYKEFRNKIKDTIYDLVMNIDRWRLNPWNALDLDVNPRQESVFLADHREVPRPPYRPTFLEEAHEMATEFAEQYATTVQKLGVARVVKTHTTSKKPIDILKFDVAFMRNLNNLFGLDPEAEYREWIMGTRQSKECPRSLRG